MMEGIIALIPSPRAAKIGDNDLNVAMIVGIAADTVLMPLLKLLPNAEPNLSMYGIALSINPIISVSTGFN